MERKPLHTRSMNLDDKMLNVDKVAKMLMLSASGLLLPFTLPIFVVRSFCIKLQTTSLKSTQTIFTKHKKSRKKRGN